MSNFTASGTGVIVFAQQIPFSNGGGVNSYIIQSTLEKKNTNFVVKEFYKSGEAITLKEKGTLWAVTGILNENKYKDKHTGEWVNGGLYIEVLNIIPVVDDEGDTLSPEDFMKGSN